MSQSNGTDYLYDGFIEEPDKTPQEQHFYSFKKFVEEYVENLTSKEVEINDGDDATLGKIWDSFNDCVKFKFQSYEVLRFDELMQTDNKLLQKILLVISVLCDEMKQLKELVCCVVFSLYFLFLLLTSCSVNRRLRKRFILH
jgi:hypothetical protein